MRTRVLLSLVALLLAAVPLGLRPSVAFAAPTCFGKSATHVMHRGDPAYYGTLDDDVVVGSAGKDVIEVGFSGGTDLVCGNAGNDFLTVTYDGSIADGGAGNDDVEAYYGAIARGGSGADFVFAEFGGAADGGSGNDYVQGYYAGVLLGGSGNDSVQNIFGTQAIDCGSGHDRVQAYDTTDVRRCESPL